MSKPTQDGFEPIAIIGTGAIMPGASDAKAFWQVIYNGEDLITEIPEAYWQTKDYFDPDPKARDKLYCKKGAFIKPIEFDAMEFGITPQNLEATDSSQLLALSATKQVLENVYGDYSKANLDQTGVILGATGPQELILYMAARLDEPIWRQALNDFDYPSQDIDKICQQIKSYYPEWQENTFPGLLSNVIAGRVANRFNLGGTNCAIDAACASALAAIRMAIFELQNHRAEMMIAGGVDSFQSAPMFMCFAKTTALSFSGDCRPFSADADGTVLGEGLCFFALKRLADAERDGDPIYAVIRGMGSSSDGFGKSVYAPDADGQAKAIKRTYQHLDYSTDSIELLEAHGTGTKVGDATEFEGLKKSFSNLRNNVCALGSIKSQIGHSKGTAGAAGLFKAAMALHHKTLPATLKIDAPNPKMDLENSNFYLNTELRPWIRSKQHPRRAGVSAFGFGGSNYHMAIEEYTGKNQPKTPSGH
ncbi:MAG: hypothetical protein K0U12_05645, partial [Gammaproteobacteria bacterium]|nr:hypothetical protein [Gammaproteobacteria bacterium]